MNRAKRQVVVVGGGSAGWITAGLVAAEHLSGGTASVVLVESPDVPIIGVGEGTWPSMRSTLKRLGISEPAFVRECDASFKQGTRFLGWSGRLENDSYVHPFSWPLAYADVNPALHWLADGGATPFAETVTPQAEVIARGLAPKQAAMPHYAFAVNYGYHLNAGKFAELLQRHAVKRLGVRHLQANVVGVESRDNGDIEALILDNGARTSGDLFVDCTGAKALLVGEHFGQELVSVADVLFNDRAIVAQIPYADADNDAIAPVTQATAQDAGWIWDIGLPTRRGLGHVHASAHIDEEAARQALERYIAATAPSVSPSAIDYRRIAFAPGFRRTAWVRNCVAVGLAAGFVEPLEASALALVEQAATHIAEQLPQDREIMEVVARRFNAKMHTHWQRIVEFLKLHYAASGREDTAYWREHRQPDSWPESLREKMTLWQQQPPWHDDAPMLGELFPSASYQYVLYGMDFSPRYRQGEPGRAEAVRHRTQEQANRLVALLPTTRELVRGMAEQGRQ